MKSVLAAVLIGVLSLVAAHAKDHQAVTAIRKTFVCDQLKDVWALGRAWHDYALGGGDPQRFIELTQVLFGDGSCRHVKPGTVASVAAKQPSYRSFNGLYAYALVMGEGQKPVYGNRIDWQAKE